jgi:hypothetical protein
LGAKQQSRQNQQRNRRRIRGGAGRPQAKTADQLDADMDSYMEVIFVFTDNI